MKILLLILTTVVVFGTHAATWTFHNFRDNSPTIRFVYYDLDVGDVQTRYIYWDWAYDMAEPDTADSGYYHVIFGVIQSDSQLGYHDSYMIDVEEWMPLINATLWGGFPIYGGGLDFRTGIDTPGEYWIDFAPDGTARISTTQPADFGKWAWDGSINPSWVEPQPGKRLAKGQKK